jgi:hypothetical protein
MAAAAWVKPLYALNLVCLVVALSVRHWSVGDVTDKDLASRSGERPSPLPFSTGFVVAVGPTSSCLTYFPCSQTPPYAGDVNIGLWSACADVPGDNVFANDDGKDCRLGHCIESIYITIEANREAHNLCDNSRAVAGLLLVDVILLLIAVYSSVLKPALGQPAAHGWAAINNASAGKLCWGKGKGGRAEVACPRPR